MVSQKSSRCNHVASLLVACLAFLSVVSAFSQRPVFATRPSSASSTATTQINRDRMDVTAGVTTVEPPTREKTDRKTGRKTGDDDTFDDFGEDDWDYPDLEYLIDSAESREMDDPYHILLMGSTFEKPKVTVQYVSNSLEYVLGMPLTEAKELAKFAKDEGMSCLGTWPREECLNLGKQLQVRDIVCRVVPYCEGGQRGWQAKDASGAGKGAHSSD